MNYVQRIYRTETHSNLGPPSFPVLPLATQQPSVGRRNFPSQQPLPVDVADDLTKLDDLAKDDVLTEDVFEEPEISQLAKRMKLSNDEVKALFVHDGIKIPSDYSSSSVGVVCRLSPILNMGFFPNALSYKAEILYGAFS